MAPCPWGAYAPGTIAFCERRLCAWVVEPSNAWSNVAYLVVGAVILWRHGRRPSLALIGAASIAIGLGSFSFHGTGTRVGELIDVSAMYLMSCLGLIFALQRVAPMHEATLVGAYLAMVAASTAAMIVGGSNGILVFAGELTAGVALELYLYRQRRGAADYRAMRRLVGSFALAFFIWNLDKWGVVCAPDNHLVTGHAVWHTLTALAIFYFASFQAQFAPAAEVLARRAQGE
jgi:hypothetical protein